ncbi:hypothetical protein [Flavobacterium sp. PL02]|uniref:hypothetical protein n=1 Tax=Flavobacterium sp. PL02 TaxID=3088354 RepID=UPI002B23B851|nr:hypothetical protein [Flavobacterium sp. PL02]MEA9412592.1 hypothetical protein [Flavobacterium sp. PL02]
MASKKYKPSEYIDQILIPGIEKIKEVEPFYCFSVISCTIEFLGSFYDNVSFGDYEPELPYKRFKKGLELFENTKYQSVIKDIYYGMRCGFAHSGRPSERIALTTEAEIKNGDEHLKNIGSKEPNSCTLFVLETFIEDFKKACEVLKKDITNSEKVDSSKAKKTYATTISNMNGMYTGGTFSQEVHIKNK